MSKRPSKASGDEGQAEGPAAKPSAPGSTGKPSKLDKSDKLAGPGKAAETVKAAKASEPARPTEQAKEKKPTAPSKPAGSAAAAKPVAGGGPSAKAKASATSAAEASEGDRSKLVAKPPEAAGPSSAAAAKPKATGKGKKGMARPAMNLSQPGPRELASKPAPFSRVLANARPTPASPQTPVARTFGDVAREGGSAIGAGMAAGAEQRENIEDLINSVLDAAEKDPSVIEGDDLPDLPIRNPEGSGGRAGDAGVAGGSKAKNAKPSGSGPGARADAPGIRSMLGAAASGSAPVLDSERSDGFTGAEAGDGSDDGIQDGGRGDEGTEGEEGAGAAGGQTLSNTLDLRPAALRDVKTMSQLHAERQSRFVPTTQPTMHPRKVRGGVKLSSKEGPVSIAWSAARWMRLVEDCAPNENLSEGLEYARNGQTKTLVTGPGLISARVQGRMPFAYTTEIRLPPLSFQQWDQALDVMVKEARPLAALLAGEVPQNIEDCFTPLRLQLFPSEPSHLSLSCSCHQSAALVAQARMRALGSGGPGQPGASVGGTIQGVPTQAGPSGASVGGSDEAVGHAAHGDGVESAAPGGLASSSAGARYSTSPWCKHICCVMALVAERLAHDTFLIFHLRGLLKDDLLERLRQKRSASASGRSSAGAAESSTADHSVPVYQPQIIGITDVVGAPLDQSLDGFWETPATAEPQEPIELRMEPPAVSHPLLRRLGSSPFQGARFPLVGLLATCYESIGQRMFQPEVPRLAALPGSTLAGSLPGKVSGDQPGTESPAQA